MFGNGHSNANIKSIAKVLRVEIQTAEVCIIDAYCAVAPMISIKKLASELNIYSPNIDKVARLIEQGSPTLRQIKNALDGIVSYNQIKVVLAAMIRDEINEIM